MREQPWHDRRVTSEHEQWYRRLVDTHQHTLAWTSAFESASTVEFPPSLAENGLESMLDDTAPEELLLRLEASVQAAQAKTLDFILAKLGRPRQAGGRKTVQEKLEEASLKAGRACALARWPELAKSRKADLQSAFLSLCDCLLKPRAGWSHFLVKRLTANEARLEWLGCPHQQALPDEIQRASAAILDLLCLLQLRWCEGFVSALSSRISIHYQPGEPRGTHRCEQNWTFAP